MKTVRLYASGGLGNQLFQVAAALSITQADRVLIDPTLLPRSTHGVPDVLHCSWPPSMLELVAGSGGLRRRVVSAAFASGLEDSWLPSLARPLSRFAASVVTSFQNRRVSTFAVGRGNGYSLTSDARAGALAGYFQSWRYVLEGGLLSTFVNAVRCVDSPWLDEVRLDAAARRPICIHVRLTDYRDASAFGIPSLAYYRQAAEHVASLADSEVIWLFSDEPQEAMKFLESVLKPYDVRVMAHGGASPAQMLSAMSCGVAYIIANSTFSYWAALLSGSEQVVAPSPWFSGLKPFMDFLPPGWIRMSSSV